ncbi:MAG: hypothetical protein HFI50_12620 [Lachnospiraceae bacterium]|nr:hypothetical protein [Lachnospiraceae bacterium]
MMNDFTLEEIYLIKSCDSDNKSGVIKELEKYLNHVDAGMEEIIHNALDKLYEITDKEFIDLRNYPDDVMM